MELTEKLLSELQRRLKIGNRRGVHLNAIPANSRYKFDLNRLSITADLISTQTIFELKTLGYERFLRLQDNIHKVCDLEDKQNLASIFSKLSFPTLD